MKYWQLKNTEIWLAESIFDHSFRLRLEPSMRQLFQKRTNPQFWKFNFCQKKYTTTWSTFISESIKSKFLKLRVGKVKMVSFFQKCYYGRIDQMYLVHCPINIFLYFIVTKFDWFTSTNSGFRYFLMNVVWSKLYLEIFCFCLYFL